MDKPTLYRQVNEQTRQQNKKVIEKYANKFQWRPDGNDSIIDIGCGCGDVTTDLLLPILPSNFSRLFGTDVSSEMIDYARTTYNHPKVTFEKLDIVEDLENFLNLHEPFDHLTSFFCLHWVQNLKKAMENIHRLLQPNGDCLLTFLAYTSLNKTIDMLAESSKWSKYFEGAEAFSLVYQNSSDPVNDYRQVFQDGGFVDCEVELQEFDYVFDRIDDIKKFAIAVNPVYNRIPKERSSEYINDLVDLLKVGDSKYMFHLKLIVAYGRKTN